MLKQRIGRQPDRVECTPHLSQLRVYSLAEYVVDLSAAPDLRDDDFKLSQRLTREVIGAIARRPAKPPELDRLRRANCLPRNSQTIVLTGGFPIKARRSEEDESWH